MTIGENYLANIKTELIRYKKLAEKSMQQLPDKHLFYTKNDNTNSIAVIVKHMHGNMLSRWSNFLTTDGEKPWRKRDGEFENTITTREELDQLWHEGWQCVLSAIDPLNEQHLTQTVHIRGEACTVLEAINRQLAHYSYHVGQIVFAAKELTENEWTSLSIPKKK
jgi:Protein of unknown function (DUF1572)